MSPVTSLVDSVAGTHAKVWGLVPEGVNSHTFQPAPSAARKLAGARILFAAGLNLEEPVLKLASGVQGPEIVDLGRRSVPASEWIHDPAFPEGDPNPHVWLNPRYALAFAGVIRDELAEAAPAGAAAFRAGHDALAAALADLDAALRAATATVPAASRELLTFHDSFPYFAREYGWRVIGAIQPSSYSNPSPRDVAALIAQIRAEGVPAVFGSEVFPSPVLRQIARETGVRYVADLRDDDLPGEPGGPEHSYIGLMKFNFITIVESLGGDAGELRRVDASPTRSHASYPQ